MVAQLDADHLATEFIVRLRPKINRKALKFFSLTSNTSAITAIGNDYGFDRVFKELRSHGRTGRYFNCSYYIWKLKKYIESVKISKKNEN